MTAARYDLIIDQGSDFALELTVKEAGIPKDLTDWLGRAQLRSTKEATTAAETFSVTRLEPYATSGKVKLSLSYAQSAAMTAGTYYYDLELYEPSNPAGSADVQVLRIISGTASIRREVTR